MAVIYRPDYAKFVFELPRGLFRQYYEEFCRESHNRKFKGDFLRSHHIQALPTMDADRERTVLEVWGEWAGLVSSLPFDAWAPALKRFDVRGIQWDADGQSVLDVGQCLQRATIGYNVEVFNSKSASKRMGRDRGGQGFRVGSRKSDLCLVVYKRGGEPTAVEFRFQGRILRRALEMTVATWEKDDRVFDRWARLVEYSAAWGDKRLTRAMEAAGLGTYWPTSEMLRGSDVMIAQRSFAAVVDELGTDPDTSYDAQFGGFVDDQSPLW